MSPLLPSQNRIQTHVTYFAIALVSAATACSNPVDATYTPPPGETTLKFKFVAAGAHTCALTQAGDAYCWGYNGEGQLGNDNTSFVNSIPVRVSGGIKFATIGVPVVSDFTCGLTKVGAAYCWGDNTGNFLGDGTNTERHVPTPVLGGIRFRSLSVGGLHACGIATNGTLWCWGRALPGSASNGSAGVPTVTSPGIAFESVYAGYDYTCGLTPAGAAYCWGRGNLGQLGNGSNANRAEPTLVSGGLTFRTLAVGGVATCGLTIAGKAYCWGNNAFGTIGDGTSSTTDGTSKRPTPVAVNGDRTFQSISMGYETACAVANDGKAFCWGYNHGAVGDGGDESRTVPTEVAGGITFDSIATGFAFSCGVTTNHEVYCWGANENGGLGDGTLDARFVPTKVRTQ